MIRCDPRGSPKSGTMEGCGQPEAGANRLMSIDDLPFAASLRASALVKTLSI